MSKKTKNGGWLFVILLFTTGMLACVYWNEARILKKRLANELFACAKCGKAIGLAEAQTIDLEDQFVGRAKIVHLCLQHRTPADFLRWEFTYSNGVWLDRLAAFNRPRPSEVNWDGTPKAVATAGDINFLATNFVTLQEQVLKFVSNLERNGRDDGERDRELAQLRSDLRRLQERTNRVVSTASNWLFEITLTNGWPLTNYVLPYTITNWAWPRITNLSVVPYSNRFSNERVQ